MKKDDIIMQSVVSKYYEKFSTVMINDEIKNRLYEVADKIADDIMEKYHVKTVLYEKTKDLVNDKGEIVVTIILTPKELLNKKLNP